MAHDRGKTCVCYLLSNKTREAEFSLMESYDFTAQKNPAGEAGLFYDQILMAGAINSGTPEANDFGKHAGDGGWPSL
jgi:hypothetical protein